MPETDLFLVIVDGIPITVVPAAALHMWCRGRFPDAHRVETVPYDPGAIP